MTPRVLANQPASMRTKRGPVNGPRFVTRSALHLWDAEVQAGQLRASIDSVSGTLCSTFSTRIPRHVLRSGFRAIRAELVKGHIVERYADLIAPRTR
jgi:hypothetical protein